MKLYPIKLSSVLSVNSVRQINRFAQYVVIGFEF